MIIKRKTEFARKLRHEATEAERKLWLRLRGDQMGFRFRRQLSIGPYIADFACPSNGLVIELDGDQHAGQKNYDEERTAFFKEKGYKVLRFWNDEIFENLESVINTIWNNLSPPPPETSPLSPSLQGKELREKVKNKALEPVPVKPSPLDKIVVRGGKKLNGEIPVSGAKNSALKLMCAALLTDKSLYLENMPNGLRDIESQVQLLEYFGCAVKSERDLMAVNTSTVEHQTAPYDIVRKMRGSILVLGPLLARFAQAKVSLPGGCAIGTRPVDMHLDALRQMGAEITIKEGYIHAHVPQERLKGAKILFPKVSVGATENLMMAATLAEGTTTLGNAAREPEITDLGQCLIKMGAKIEGLGTQTITITGVNQLDGAHHRVLPDRIETGTYMIAVAMTGGTVRLKNARMDHLAALVALLRDAGVHIEEHGPDILVSRNGAHLKGVDIMTEPYPGFPTDLQAQFMAMLCMAEGAGMVTETIFENRFMHVQELNRMGADIRVQGNSAIVRGVESLTGAEVMATDLRASVALILAGLVAKGETTVNRIYHLERGYEDIVGKLRRVGADVEKISG